jgi:hypothetical protein
MIDPNAQCDIHINRDGSRILVRGGGLSDCNGLSGSNPLTNRVLNKKINNLIYIYLPNKIFIKIIIFYILK